MKEIIRQYAGIAIAAIVAVMLLLVIVNSTHYLTNSGAAGRLDGCGRMLTASSSAGTFDRFWSGR